LSYRGYGKSEGIPSEKGIKLDAQATLEYLSSRPDINANKILVFGRSLGGAVAVDLCSKNPNKIHGLILENTFTSIPDMIDRVLPILSHFKFLCTIHWESIHLIENIEVPILFIISENDELVPPTFMGRLFDAATSSVKKKKVVIPQAAHMDAWTFPGYYDHFKQFIESSIVI